MHHTICPKVLACLDHFYALLTDYKTSPDLLDGIKICTLHWLHSSPHDMGDVLFHCMSCPNTSEALSLQYRFGWFHFLQGVHLTPLADVQAAYFASEHPSIISPFPFCYGCVHSALWNLLCDLHDEDRRTFLSQCREDLDPS